MTVLEVDLSFLFVIAVILIWFMIAYQFVLTVFGFINYVKSMKEQKKVDGETFDYPTCAVLIPAHNEEKVIGATIASMLNFEYPHDKLRVIVINDGSTDSTKEIQEARPKSRIVQHSGRRGGQRKIPGVKYGREACFRRRHRHL